MRHFSCDLCGKDLSAAADARYVLRMETAPVTEPGELSADDLDLDHVEAMAEMLAELEDGDTTEVEVLPASAKLEFDLCPNCHRKWLADPLGRESGRKLHFSKN